MDNLNTKAANLASHVQEITQTYYDLARINIAQAGSKAVARAFLFFLIAGLLLCILLLAGIGLSLYLGKVLNDAAAGYFIVAGFYLLLAIVFYMLRKQIVFPFIRDFIVKKIYDKAD
jgi:hypothetical protein